MEECTTEYEWQSARMVKGGKRAIGLMKYAFVSANTTGHTQTSKGKIEI